MGGCWPRGPRLGAARWPRLQRHPAGAGMTEDAYEPPEDKLGVAAHVETIEGSNLPTIHIESGGVQLGDFLAYMPQHSYIFTPTGEMWASASVNARIPPVKVGNKTILAS